MDGTVTAYSREYRVVLSVNGPDRVVTGGGRCGRDGSREDCIAAPNVD